MADIEQKIVLVDEFSDKFNRIKRELREGTITQDQFNSKVRNLSTNFKTLGTSSIQAQKGLKGLGTNLKGMTANIGQSLPGMGRFGGMLGSLGPVGIAAGASLAGLGFAFKKFYDIVNEGLESLGNFEFGLGQVATLLDESQEQEFMAGFEVQLQDLAVQSGETFDKLTKGLYDLISAGVPASESMELLTLSTQAAQAGATDTATAVDGLTTVVNAFASQGLTATQASDIFFATIRAGKTTFSELSQHIGQVAPLANAMGVSFEEVGASLAGMTVAGINTAEATTALNQSLASLSAADAVERFGEFGIQIRDSITGDLLGLGDIMGNIMEAELSDIDMSTMIPNIRARKAFLSLTQEATNAAGETVSILESGLEDFEPEILTGAMTDAYSDMADQVIIQQNRVDRSAEVMSQNIAQHFQGVQSTWLDLKQSIYSGIAELFSTPEQEIIRLDESINEANRLTVAITDFKNATMETIEPGQNFNSVIAEARDVSPQLAIALSQLVDEEGVLIGTTKDVDAVFKQFLNTQEAIADLNTATIVNEIASSLNEFSLVDFLGGGVDLAQAGLEQNKKYLEENVGLLNELQNQYGFGDAVLASQFSRQKALLELEQKRIDGTIDALEYEKYRSFFLNNEFEDQQKINLLTQQYLEKNIDIEEIREQLTDELDSEADVQSIINHLLAQKETYISDEVKQLAEASGISEYILSNLDNQEDIYTQIQTLAGNTTLSEKERLASLIEINEAIQQELILEAELAKLRVEEVQRRIQQQREAGIIPVASDINFITNMTSALTDSKTRLSEITNKITELRNAYDDLDTSVSDATSTITSASLSTSSSTSTTVSLLEKQRQTLIDISDLQSDIRINAFDEVDSAEELNNRLQDRLGVLSQLSSQYGGAGTVEDVLEGVKDSAGNWVIQPLVTIDPAASVEIENIMETIDFEEYQLQFPLTIEGVEVRSEIEQLVGYLKQQYQEQHDERVLQLSNEEQLLLKNLQITEIEIALQGDINQEQRNQLELELRQEQARLSNLQALQNYEETLISQDRNESEINELIRLRSDALESNVQAMGLVLDSNATQLDYLNDIIEAEETIANLQGVISATGIVQGATEGQLTGVSITGLGETNSEQIAQNELLIQQAEARLQNLRALQSYKQELIEAGYGETAINNAINYRYTILEKQVLAMQPAQTEYQKQLEIIQNQADLLNTEIDVFNDINNNLSQTIKYEQKRLDYIKQIEEKQLQGLINSQEADNLITNQTQLLERQRDLSIAQEFDNKTTSLEEQNLQLSRQLELSNAIDENARAELEKRFEIEDINKQITDIQTERAELQSNQTDLDDEYIAQLNTQLGLLEDQKKAIENTSDIVIDTEIEPVVEPVIEDKIDWEAIGIKIGNQLASSIGDTLGKVVAGDEIESEEIGKSIGNLIGTGLTAVLSAYMGPIGGMIGSALTPLISEGFGALFDSGTSLEEIYTERLRNIEANIDKINAKFEAFATNLDNKMRFDKSFENPRKQLKILQKEMDTFVDTMNIGYMTTEQRIDFITAKQMELAELQRKLALENNETEKKLIEIQIAGIEQTISNEEQILDYQEDRLELEKMITAEKYKQAKYEEEITDRTEDTLSDRLIASKELMDIAIATPEEYSPEEIATHTKDYLSNLKEALIEGVISQEEYDKLFDDASVKIQAGYDKLAVVEDELNQQRIDKNIKWSVAYFEGLASGRSDDEIKKFKADLLEMSDEDLQRIAEGDFEDLILPGYYKGDVKALESMAQFILSDEIFNDLQSQFDTLSETVTDYGDVLSGVSATQDERFIGTINHLDREIEMNKALLEQAKSRGDEAEVARLEGLITSDLQEQLDITNQLIAYMEDQNFLESDIHEWRIQGLDLETEITNQIKEQNNALDGQDKILTGILKHRQRIITAGETGIGTAGVSLEDNTVQLYTHLAGITDDPRELQRLLSGFSFPQFAEGGFMPEDGLAWINRNELVLTPDQQSNIINNSNENISKTINLTISDINVYGNNANDLASDFTTQVIDTFRELNIDINKVGR